MSEIPGPVWIGVGVFVGGFSLFLGFIKKIDTAPFFQLMTVIALGMIIYGFIKLKFPKRSEQDLLDEMGRRRATRGVRDYEIDMEDYKNNPQLRHQAMQHKQNFQQRYTTNQEQTGYQNPHQHPLPHDSHKEVHHKGSKTSAFCSQCGSPLMKNHKFCPICGNRL